MLLAGHTTRTSCLRTAKRGRLIVQTIVHRLYSSGWTLPVAKFPSATIPASLSEVAPPQAGLATNATSAMPREPLGDTSDLRQARVAIMSIPACPYCKLAKEALTSAGIPYVDVNVASDQSLRQLVRDITGKRTVPQIFVAGRSIGGSDDLLVQLRDGSFAKMLAEAEAAAAAVVPPDLLEAIQAAQQRADALAEAAKDPAAVATSRLGELRTRLGLPEIQGGIGRRECTIGLRTFKVFTWRALIDWLSAAGEADPGVAAVQLMAANVVVPASLDRAEAERVAAGMMAVAAAAAAPARAASAGAAGAVACGPQSQGVMGGGERDEEKEEEQLLVLTLSTEAPQPPAGEALNCQFWWQGPARSANEVAASLRHLILDLYDKHLSKDGRSLSYGAVRSDPQFAAFVTATAELQKVDLSPLSREELLAFGINLYNALVIHALIALNLTRMNASQRTTFYSRTAKYNVGGLDYSADDLENGLLRGNRAGAANLFNVVGLHGLAGEHWRGGDRRLAKVVSPVDPRIHFALVCGAKSCPPIKLYTPSNLEEGLAAAAEAFCAGEVEVTRARREVKLSKIFKWYAIDFGSNKYERLSYIASFLSEPSKGDMLEMVRQARSGGGDVRLLYKEYDWSLNGTD